MSEFTYWPLVVTAAVVGGAVAHARILKAVQPLRLELADKGRILLSTKSLSEECQNFVKFLLDHAFSFRGGLLFAIVAIPIFGMCLLIAPSKLDSPLKKLDPGTASSLRELVRLHDRITLANHPILMMILEFEILLVLPAAVLISGLIRGNIPKKGDRESVMTLLEAKEARAFVHRKAV
jgi:hypothetical protein